MKLIRQRIEYIPGKAMTAMMRDPAGPGGVEIEQ